MLDFKEKRKLRGILYSKLMIIFLGLILVFLINAVWGVYTKAKIANDNKEIVLQNFSELKQRKEELSSRIQKLDTERGVEEELRKKFGVVKNGEEVVVVINPEINENKEKIIFNSQGLWQKFLGVFKRN